MGECGISADSRLLGPVRPFSLPFGENLDVPDSEISRSGMDGYSTASSSSSSTSSCALRSSLKRPKAIGLQRFNFSLVDESFSACSGSHKQQHQLQQHQQPLPWECNQSTSYRTWERSSCRQARSASISTSMPCLPTSSGAGQLTNILPFLFLGSQHDALSEDVIKRNGITHVLNVSTTSPRSPFVSDRNFLRIPVNDSHTDRLLPHFQKAFQFIDGVQTSHGCVLVHCLAGISRSPTLVIAYVMRCLSMNTDQAYSFVKERRSSISPNFNFLGQLVEFESLCHQLNDKGALGVDELVECTVGVEESNCPMTEHQTSSSCSELQKIVELEPCLVENTSDKFHFTTEGAFDREEAKLNFPSDWEMQFVQASTDSLDKLCFTPCFALVPNDAVNKNIFVQPIDNSNSNSKSNSNCSQQSSIHSNQFEEPELKQKPARGRRRTPRPRGPPIPSVQFGFASIKTSLKSSIKSSIFKRAEHHSKPVFLMD